MCHSNPANIIDRLDLKDPGDLLIAFHYLRTWPVIRPMDDENSTREFEIIQRYHSAIFGAPDHDLTCTAINTFLWALGGTKPGTRAEYVAPCAPREWLYVFRQAFNQGVIGPVAFGAAYRFLMVRTGGNGAPGQAPDSLKARRVMLDDARRASPLGLMDDDERLVLANLHDSVTLWRGGRGDFGQTPSERALGLHWALDREYAVSYMRGRGAQRTLVKLHSAVADFSGLSIGRQLSGERRSFIEQLGEPFLLRASIPKKLALAYIAAGAHGEQVEVLVDFESLTPAMIEDVTPKAKRWAA